MPMSRRYTLVLCACAALCQPLWSAAQPAWPAGAPIKIVTPTPVGVGTDLFARVYAERLSRELNTAIIVENRPGASGMLGIDAVAKSPPNGLTLLISVSRPFTTPAELLPKMPSNPAQSLVAVTQLYHSGSFIIAGSTFPGNSLNDLIAIARQRPGYVSYASYGGASTARLGMELLQDAAGIALLQVPYKQSAMPDLLGGQVMVGWEPPASAVPSIKAGKLKALAFVGERRSAALPDVPNAAEIVPGFDMIPTWVGLWTPPGTPTPIIKRLQSAVAAVNKDPALLRILADSGAEPRNATQAQMTSAIQRELEMTSRLVKAKNITLE
ncbi:MAG: putative Bug-like extra-cytoplasmic solute receptor, TTT-family [Ramlibacter sp.]|nr:putative Bug-like extra-cytoplasmic solute receptor, TTT-family [Ramlibacter sp.]